MHEELLIGDGIGHPVRKQWRLLMIGQSLLRMLHDYSSFLRAVGH